MHIMLADATKVNADLKLDKQNNDAAIRIY